MKINQIHLWMLLAIALFIYSFFIKCEDNKKDKIKEGTNNSCTPV